MTIQRIVAKIEEIILRPHVEYGIQTLKQNNSLHAQMLADAITDAFHQHFTEEELQWFSKIEQVRNDLNDSTEIISITDYGAHAKNGMEVITRSVGKTSRISSKSERWLIVLFSIIRRFAPQRCIELGTCLGISTMYQSAALTLNGVGNIVTLEGAQSLADYAVKNIERLGLRNVVSVVGRFSDTLAGVIEQHQPFDFAFIDGHHEGSATIQYFEQLLPSLRANSIVVFDDVHWSSSMKNAWNVITQHRRVQCSVDLYQIGIVIMR